MGYEVLISLDLPKVTETKREKFYKVLASESWIKIHNLSTTWRVSIKDNLDRETVIKILKKDLLKAKNESEVSKVDFAIQMDKSDVIISSF